MPTIEDLKKVVKPLRYIGNSNAVFNKLISFDTNNTADDALMWIVPTKNVLLESLQKGTVICEETSMLPSCSHNVNLVIVANARLAFRQVLEAFFSKTKPTGVHSTAIIHESVIIGQNCFVGAYVVIEEGCNIGDNVSIGHHTVIMHGTIIEDFTIIGTHCSIGGDGFGYEKDEQGHYIQIPHIGYIHLKSNVDIGNNVCIDRGTLGTTMIGEWSRIDNLVHIAHNVQIGMDTLVIAQSMVAGSCVIGNNVWIAPNAAIINKAKVANGATIGLGSVVFKDVNEGDTVLGYPARVIKV